MSLITILSVAGLKEGATLNNFVINDGFMFRANHLCIPVLMLEAHGGWLIEHFGAMKTKDVLASHFFWPKMWRDIEGFVACCITCQEAKFRLNPHSLYIPLPFPSTPWANVLYGLCFGVA